MGRRVRAMVLFAGIVTIVIPSTIIYRTGPVQIGWSLPLPLSLAPIEDAADMETITKRR